MLAPAAAAALLCASASAVHAAPEGEVTQTVTEEVAATRERDWFFLPVLFWLPETKIGAAATGGLHFRLRGSPRTSDAFLVAAYSLERQGSIDAATDVYLRRGTLVSARFRAVHFPDVFYGVGPETPEEHREEYTRRFLDLTASVELPALRGRLRAGPRLNARAEEIDVEVPGGRLDASGLPGVHGFRALGVGASVSWDTRDRPLWPSRGAYAQASYVAYPEPLATTGSFGKGVLDLRLFLPLGAERVLALGTVVESADGAAPFSLLSRLGSTRFFRGYREGRYRERLSWATQSELRVPLARRLFGVAFAAVGDVARSPSALRADTVKVAGGLGARVRLTDAGANLRLDVAASGAGAEVYVLLLEAF